MAKITFFFRRILKESNVKPNEGFHNGEAHENAQTKASTGKQIRKAIASMR